MAAGASARAQAARLQARNRGRVFATATSTGVLGAAAGGLLFGSLSWAVATGVAVAVAAAMPRRRAVGSSAWSVGAEGEEATARLLAPLAREGWTILHDRAIPGSRANLDHLLVSPGGAVVVVDSKRWRRGWTVTAPGGRLLCGARPQQRDVDSLMFEARRVHQVLGVPVYAVMAVHGATVARGRLSIRRPEGAVEVIGAEALAASLRVAAARVRSEAEARQLAARSAQAFPPYLASRTGPAPWH